MSHAYVLGGCRTPIGKFLGGLAGLPAPRLGAVAIAEALRRTGIAPDRIDEVIMGEILTAGVGQAPARQAALAAGLPPAVAALTINKMCGSGLKAVMLADQAIRAGDVDVHRGGRHGKHEPRSASADRHARGLEVRHRKPCSTR